MLDTLAIKARPQSDAIRITILKNLGFGASLLLLTLILATPLSSFAGDESRDHDQAGTSSRPTTVKEGSTEAKQIKKNKAIISNLNAEIEDHSDKQADHRRNAYLETVLGNHGVATEHYKKVNEHSTHILNKQEHVNKLTKTNLELQEKINARKERNDYLDSRAKDIKQYDKELDRLSRDLGNAHKGLQNLNRKAKQQATKIKEYRQELKSSQ